MSNEAAKPLSRDQVVPLLVRRFTKDYEEAIRDYEPPQKLELTEHLWFAVDLMVLHAQTNGIDIYSYYLELEDELLKKYRKTFRPYVVKHFFKYFWFDQVLIEKGIYSREEFNRLAPEYQRLSLEEITDFVDRCRDILYCARFMIYLQMDPEGEQASRPALPEPVEQDKNFTRARQLLAIHYLLKAGWGIEHRDNHTVTASTKFAHLLTGTRFTTPRNSNIYKMMREVPDYKEGELLIADLEFIRPFFEELKIAEAVRLIDEKIGEVQKLPSVARKIKSRGKR